MFTAQLAPGATLAQLCVAAKSAIELATEETASIALPLLVIESVAAELVVPTTCGGKLTNPLSSAIAAVATPVPERLRRSGLPTTFELTTSSPLDTAVAARV